MSGVINTPAINMDINPGLWMADERIQRLGGLGVALLNVMAYATRLSATTGSAYVDGEFHVPTALLEVRHLEENLDLLVEAGLVTLDGEVGLVSLRETTSHENLQSAADARQERASTQAATRAKAKADSQAKRERTEEKRRGNAERQQRHRDNHPSADRADFVPGNCIDCHSYAKYLTAEGQCGDCARTRYTSSSPALDAEEVPF